MEIPLNRLIFVKTWSKKYFTVAILVLSAVRTFAVKHKEIVIDAGPAKAIVSPMHHGLMTEEINHSYDGGLYAEVIQNRSFKDDEKRPVHWSAFPSEESSKLTLDRDIYLSADQPVSLRVDAVKLGGVANDGYWGIPIYPKTKYRLRFFARTGLSGPKVLTAKLVGDDGTLLGEARISGVTDSWKKFECELTTVETKPSSKAKFAVVSETGGTFWLSVVSVFPPTWKDRPNGMRRDLMQMMASMHPGFLRFPGGNYLEGYTHEARFKWKETLGPIEERPGHQGPWGYRSSDGVGLLEFLLWCEDLGMEPVLGIYAGYALDGKHITHGRDLEPFIQDALEEIEYVTGSSDTKWGARRAADGHPAPFKLRYVEIGNEDWFDKSGSYKDRYVQFHDAIKKHYPSLKLISSIGSEQKAELLVDRRTPDVLDEHYYRSTDEFIENAHQFESYRREGQEIFVGEWAAHEDSSLRPWDKGSQALAPTPSMLAAIGDAVWMTTMERNADLITMQCYAPLFVNVNPGARQWRPNLIGYDAIRSYGSPSYHTICMFAQNIGDEILKISACPEGLYVSATRESKTGTIYIKIVNRSAGQEAFRLKLSGSSEIRSGRMLRICADSNATNTIENPNMVLPIEAKTRDFSDSINLVVPENSINVFVARGKESKN